MASTNPTSPCATVAAGPAAVAVISEMKVSQQDVAARAQAASGTLLSQLSPHFRPAAIIESLDLSAGEIQVCDSVRGWLSARSS